MKKPLAPPIKTATVTKLKPKKRLKSSITETKCGALATELQRTKTVDLPTIKELKAIAMEAIDSDFCMAYLGSTPTLIHDYDKATNRPIKITKLNTEGYLDYLKALPYKCEVTNSEGNIEWERRDLDGFSMWKKSAFANRKNTVIYDPSTTEEGRDYNLWSGYCAERITEKPCRNYPAIFEKYIYEVVAPFEPEAARYILNWLAHMFQFPELKPAVAIIVYSIRKGTGKSLLADIIFELIGRHAIRLASANQLLGKFTGHLSDKQFINAEESAFAGSSKASDELKNLITSHKQFLEQKGKDGFEVDSFVRLYITSNHLHSVQVSSDERRFLVVNNDKTPFQHKDPFFSEVAIRSKKSGEKTKLGKPDLSKVKALYDYLMEMDISDFDPSNVPDTLAMSEQKLLSETPLESFCKHVMTGGFNHYLPDALFGDYWCDAADSKIWFKRSFMMAAFLEYEKQFHASKRSHVTERTMETQLERTKLFPTHITTRQGKDNGHLKKGARYWVFDYEKEGNC